MHINLQKDIEEMANIKLAALSEEMTKEAVSPGFLMGKMKNQVMTGANKLEHLISAGMPKAQALKFTGGKANVTGRVDDMLHRMGNRVGKMDPAAKATQAAGEGVSLARDKMRTVKSMGDKGVATVDSVNQALGTSAAAAPTGKVNPFDAKNKLFSMEDMPAGDKGSLFNNVGMPSEIAPEMYNNPVIDAIRKRGKGKAPAAAPAAAPKAAPAVQPKPQNSRLDQIQNNSSLPGAPQPSNPGWFARIFGG